MITQQITAIALRVFSMWLLIQLILSLPSLVLLFVSIEEYQQTEIPPAGYLGIIGSIILIGLIAVFLLNKVANSVLIRAKFESGTTLSLDSQRLLFQLAGLYFIVNALAYLPRSLAFIPMTDDISLSNLLWSVGLALQLGIGIWLVIGSTFWINLFIKLRGRA